MAMKINQLMLHFDVDGSHKYNVELKKLDIYDFIELKFKKPSIYMYELERIVVLLQWESFEIHLELIFCGFDNVQFSYLFVS